ncbi:hypothetical protein L1987_33749 [Smallanthus sonchifolius]|uniref:Uncharacterized protein n=1 Tax=Smallanthus sonchifolius TaxID=185202 RepID=A0ACB9HRM8_9ASTR|nr:hypothetical protein L1987_33749 [Smallanthus sonchifolius]
MELVVMTLSGKDTKWMCLKVLLDMFDISYSHLRYIFSYSSYGTPVDTWLCYGLPSLEGNPYLINGCKDNYEYYYYGEHPTEECKRCHDSGGYCRTENIYDVDGSVVDKNSTCNHYHDEKGTSLGVILVDRIPRLSMLDQKKRLRFNVFTDF